MEKDFSNFLNNIPEGEIPDGFRRCIVSLPDRENVVFEIRFGKSQLAEVSHEPGQPLIIEVYNHPESKEWRFPLEEFLNLLLQAKEELKDLT